MKHRSLTLALAASAAALASGCSKPPEQQAIPPSPVVTQGVTLADVTVVRDYPGTSASVQMVEINARVEGWVIKQNFKDGQMVQEGSTMYQIDPRPFEVALEKALADMAVAEAEYKNAKQKVERNRPLVEVQAISAEQFDQLVANERSTKAATEARLAAVDQARLNLSYCTVKALASGQASKTQVYTGTLVGPTVNNRMTNIQVLDPIWVQFYPIAAEIPQLRKLLESGASAIEVSVTPGDWKRNGKIVFLDNHVDQNTDTILARVQLDNKDLALLPGAYVSVRFPVKTLESAITVPENCITYQSAETIIWTVDADRKAHPKQVKIGPPGGAGVVVLSGLEKDDKIVVQGQQKLRADNTLTVEMPAGKPAAGSETK